MNETEMASSADETPSLGILLTSDSYFHILESVLDFLPAKTLRETCSRVCSYWKPIAERIHDRRRSLSWGLHGLEPPEEQFRFLKERLDEAWTHPQTLITFTSSAKLSLQRPIADSLEDDGPPSKRNRRTPKKDKHKYVDCLVDILSSSSDPNPGEGSSDSFEPSSTASSSTASSSTAFTSRSSSNRSLDTNVYCMHARGVIGTDPEGLNHELERPIRGERTHYASYVTLPLTELASSTSSSASLSVRRLRFTSADVDENSLLKDRPSGGYYGLPADATDVKALFVFATDEAQHTAAELCEDYKKKSKGEMVIAGGFVTHLEVKERNGNEDGDDENDDENDTERDDFAAKDKKTDENSDSSEVEHLTEDLLCLAFCGRGVRAASVVVPSDVKKKSDVENKLIQLRDTGVSPRHPPVGKNASGSVSGPSPSSSPSQTMGFMFSCVAKGAHHYGESNVEANIFRKIFPGVPLTGFFGDGEIGLDVLPRFVAEEKKTARSKEDLSSGEASSAALEGAGNALVTENGVAWGQWFLQDLSDDDEDDEDFQPTLHACTTIFVVISF